MNQLQTERLVLRRPEARDTRAFLKWYASERRSNQYGPLSEADAWMRFAAEIGHWHMKGFGRFLVEDLDGQAIGLVGPHYPGGWPAPEMAWSIWWDDAEGKGYAFEAARACLERVVPRLALPELISIIAPDNERSKALATRLGATPTETAPVFHNKTYQLYQHDLDAWSVSAQKKELFT